MLICCVRFIRNAPGTGKTRLLFELLALDWGFYFVCFRDDGDPYGSADLHDVLDSLLDSNRPVPDGNEVFRPYDGKDDTPDPNAQRQNEKIAKHVFIIVLLARMLVLNEFLMEWAKETQAKSISPENARKLGSKLWCRLQIQPQMGANDDIFYSLTKALLRVSLESANEEILRLLSKWKKDVKLSRWFSLRYLIFDEAQHPSTLYPKAFCSADGQTHRSVLRPLVWFTREALKSEKALSLIVAGTKLGESMVREALVSAFGKKKAAELKPFDDLGRQADLTHIMFLLDHFFGPAFVAGIPPALLSHIEFWLPGRSVVCFAAGYDLMGFVCRYRFPAVFLQYTLQHGFSYTSMANVLYNLVFQLSHRRIDDSMTTLPDMELVPVISRTLTRALGENEPSEEILSTSQQP